MLSPFVVAFAASCPTAVLPGAVVILANAHVPIATDPSRADVPPQSSRALCPIAILLHPPQLLFRASRPKATLQAPVDVWL